MYANGAARKLRAHTHDVASSLQARDPWRRFRRRSLHDRLRDRGEETATMQPEEGTVAPAKKSSRVVVLKLIVSLPLT